MKKSKLLMVMLTVMLGVILMCFTASAATYSGDCGADGDNVKWSLDTETGKLVISGTGKMQDFEFDEAYVTENESTNISNAPWISKGTIKSVEIKEGVTSIGAIAFYFCNNIESVSISESVKSIGDLAFACCAKIEEITIPDSVKTIGTDVFFYCTDLKNLDLGNGVTHIGLSAFVGCSALENITIPDSVVEIGPWAFNLCVNLKSISISESVEIIGDNAFTGCMSLENIVVDENNQNFSSQDGVLFDKGKATLILYPFGKTDRTYKIPETVKLIPKNSFSSYNLEKLYISESVEKIENYSFSSVWGLTEVYIYNSDVEIEDNSKICYDGILYDKWLELKDEYMDLFKEVYSQGPDSDPNEVLAGYEKLDALEKEIFPDEFVPYGTIYGYSGSTAEVYADKYGINFVPFVTESTDEETDINASFKPDTFPSGTVILIDKKGQNADGTFNGKYEYYESYDISFVDENNKEVQPNGKVIVRIPVPHTFNPEKTVVYYVAPDGTATKLESWHEGKYIVFETDHFSEYVIVDESSEIIVTPEPDEPEGPDEPQKPAEKKNLFEQLIDFLTKLFNFIKNLFA